MSQIKTESSTAAHFLVAQRRRHMLVAAFALLSGLLLMVSMATGSSGLIVLQAFAGDEQAWYILQELRMPRAFAALLAGALLGASGAAMQSALRNPLASPFTLGVAQGAGFGAAVAIIVLNAGVAHGTGIHPIWLDAPSIVVLCAFTGAITSVSLILLLATVRDLSPLAVILAGVALSALFSAATMMIQYAASDLQVAATVFWTFGDVGKAGWREVWTIAALGLPALIILLCVGRRLNALLWGDDTAQGLGVNARAIRLLVMVTAALAAATPTAFLGIIAFVGLIAPHVARIFVGDDQSLGLLLSALIGAAILLLADVMARVLLAPVILPVGIITSFAGVPVLLYLLLRRT